MVKERSNYPASPDTTEVFSAVGEMAETKLGENLNTFTELIEIILNN